MTDPAAMLCVYRQQSRPATPTRHGMLQHTAEEVTTGSCECHRGLPWVTAGCHSALQPRDSFSRPRTHPFVSSPWGADPYGRPTGPEQDTAMVSATPAFLVPTQTWERPAATDGPTLAPLPAHDTGDLRGECLMLPGAARPLILLTGLKQ